MRRTRPLPRTLLLGTLAALTAGLLGAPTPALAAPLLDRAPTSVADAQTQAEQLRAHIDQLQLKAEQATEDYDAAQSALDALTTRRLLARQRLQALTARSAADNTIADNRVRALYMTGGGAGMLDSLLQSRGLDDMVDRAQIMSRILTADRSRVDDSDTAVRQARQVDEALAGLTQHQTDLERRAATAARTIDGSLAQQHRLLAAADATVRRLAAAQRRAAQRAAEQAFLTQLYAAQQAAAARAGGAGVPSGSGEPGGSDITGGAPGAPTAAAAAAIAAAKTRLGMPYVWGATGPYAFDCSGLTGWAYKQAGVLLPRTSREQWYAGPHVDLAHLAPGDLLFWATDTSDPATIHHVALYIGDGTMIAAPQPGDVVKEQPVYMTGYIGAVRPTA